MHDQTVDLLRPPRRAERGDLRVAHFLGIHAQQAIPLAAYLAGGLPRAVRLSALATATAVYAATTAWVFLEAAHGVLLIQLQI